MDEPFDNNRDLKSELEAFKVENDNLKRDYEKITIDYELKIENLKKEINLKTVNYENIMLNFQELDEKYKNSCQEKITINQNYFDLSQEKFNTVKKFDTLESEHASLLELISRREKELLNCKTEIQQLRTEITEYKTKEIESKLNQNDLEFRRKDFQQMEQMSLLRNRKLSEEIKKLEIQLADSLQTNHEEKTANNKLVYDFNLELDGKRNEIKNYRKTIEKLKEQIAHLERANGEKNDSLRSAVESQTNIDNLLRKEMNVQLSINELLKERIDESEQKEANLIEAIKELQQSLRETVEESDRMKMEFEGKLSEFTSQITELRMEINRKENELADANELFEKFRVKSLSEEEIKSMNPATAAAISALKRGYSMTQIYSEYLQVVNEKEELRVDRDRLNEYMLTILEELEEKAPMLKKQQEEHSYLELSVSTLGKKYDDNLSQLFSCQSELGEYQRKCDELTKKLKREEQTCTDLSQQVCCLLREIETHRGTIIRSDQINGDDSEFISRRRSFHQRSLYNSHSLLSITNSSLETSGNRFITANNIITTHLVTFKNICELQQQNIRLIQQFRDISEQQEATENMINESSMQDMAKKLETAYKEMDNIKEKQKQNKQLLKTVNAQKHIIQALSMVHGKSDLTSLLATGGIGVDSADDTVQMLSPMQDGAGDKHINQSNLNTISTLNEKVAESQEKIDKLLCEIDRLRDEKEELKEKHSNTIEELNQCLSEVKIANANLMAKISFNQEKTTSLEQNLINRQMELADLQNDLSESNQQLAKKSEENVSLSSQLGSCQMRLREQESEIKQMQFNRQHVESLEEQLNCEKNEKFQLMSSISEMASQISNIQIYLNKPQVEQLSEDQIELKSKIKQLTLELKHEKSKYQSSLEMWQAKFNESNAIIDTLKSQLNSENRASTSTNLTITESCTVGVLQTAPEKIEKTGDLESQLEDLTALNYRLKKQIEAYHELMTNSESKLINNSQLIDEMESKFQDRINELTEEKSEIEELLESAQLANRQLESTFNLREKSLEDKISEFENLLEHKTTAVDSLNEEMSVLKAKQCQLISDLERQRQMTKTATENYQQELIYHAQESDALDELNKQMNQIKSQERNLSEKLQETVLLRDQYKSDLESRDSIWLAEKETLESEMSELKKQKEYLNNRLVDLNDQLVSLKKLLDPSTVNSIDFAVIQRENDWNEVIQYLRQEKENVERVKNQCELDLNRLKGQYRQQEETIDQLNKTLEEERKFRVVESETHKQHSEIMLEMESKQMLMESNSKLRLDRQRVKDLLSETTAKLEKLNESIEPLKAELKSKNNEIEIVRLDARSLENERDLWRKRCDSLIEKSKQVNPEEFKQICVEKDKLQHQFLMEEENCRVNLELIDELRSKIEECERLLNEKDNQLKEINDDGQERENMIVQLKDIGRKYKTEAELLRSEKAKITSEKENSCKEIQALKREIVELKSLLEDSKKECQKQLSQASTSSNSVSQASDEFLRKLGSILQCQISPNDIIDTSERLVRDNQNNIQLLKAGKSELKVRNQVIEGHLTNLKSENERLKKQLENRSTNSNALDEENGTSEENNSEILPSITTMTSTSTSTSTCHGVPAVARVAANVHPVVQKPQTSNQISPNSQPISSCVSTAPRQTAEIRPIPAVALHVTPSSSTVDIPMAVDSSVSIATVTTSLPASVVQALAASSVATVIFPAVSSGTATSTTGSVPNIGRLKRCFEKSIEPDTSRSSSLIDESHDRNNGNAIKKCRMRLAEPVDIVPITPQEHSVTQEPQQQQQQMSQTTSAQLRLAAGMDYCSSSMQNIDAEVCEGEIEIESEEVEITEDEDENKSKNELDDSSLLAELLDGRHHSFSDPEDCVEGDFEEEEAEEEEEEDDNEDSDENEHDDDEDNNNEDEDDDEDDDDENPDVIDLLSSDDVSDSNNNNNNHDNEVNDDDNNNKYDNDKNDFDNQESSNYKDERNESFTEESELEQAKKKIEPIVWTDMNQRRNNIAVANRKDSYSISPNKLGQPIKTRYAGNAGFRRKIATTRRNFPFTTSSGRVLSVGRRSGGPFKGSFTPR